MTLARTLMKLWKLRFWLVPGVVLGIVAAAASVATSSSTVYATASTQMLVDSPSSTLANAQSDMTGYTARAGVFARLMTSDEALSYIGKAAGIPGNLIDANGPLEVNGSTTASHAPVQIQGGKDTLAPATYKLSFNQNPDLPTVDVYAQAPTTAQAIALANGAVTGFSNFIAQRHEDQLSANKRILVRQLGSATGGLVDPGASKKIALFLFVLVLALWCGAVLFVSNLRAQMRVAKNIDPADPIGPADPFAVAEEDYRSEDAPAFDDGTLRPDLQEARTAAAKERRLQANGGFSNHRHVGDPSELVWESSGDDVRDRVGPAR